MGGICNQNNWLVSVGSVEKEVIRIILF
jgi:hypothetical protein